MSINNFNKYKVIDYETYNDFDFEFAVRPYHKATHIFSYCIGDSKGNVDVRRLDTDNKQYNRTSWINLFRFWKDTAIEKIGHNIKFEINLNSSHKIPLPKDSLLHDTMIMSQMLRNLLPSHKLSFLNWELNDPEIYKIENRNLNSKELDKLVEQEAKKLSGYHRVNKELMQIYQIADGQRPMLLFMTFFPYILESEKLYRDYLNEMEVIKVTSKMEKYGLLVDRDNCQELIIDLERKLKINEKETYDLLGRFINLGSPKQLIRILYYDFYNFPIYEYTINKEPSVDKDVLLLLKQDFPNEKIFDYIIKHRSYTKGLANIKSYLDFADEFNILHHNIKTNQARTGRESSSEPNLQNVEKIDALKNPFPVKARYCFSCRKGHVMYFVDYSGIELRLIIEASNCIKMMDLMKAGKHPHILFCELFFHNQLPIEKQFTSKRVNPDLYNGGKNGHFALCYGAALGKVASTINLTVTEARQGWDVYRNMFPEIAFLVRNGIDKVKDTGFIITPFGRTLWIPKDKIYGWLNYFIQGTAAGILKRAQVNIDKYLNTIWKDSGIQLVLPIHDELLISYPRNMLKYKKIILPEISRLMINIPEIKVPLEVEWKVTTSTWDQAKGMSLAN